MKVRRSHFGEPNLSVETTAVSSDPRLSVHPFALDLQEFLFSCEMTVVNV